MNRRLRYLKEMQISCACYTAKLKQVARRRSLIRIASKCLRKQPEYVYYLRLGVVPSTLPPFIYEDSELPQREH